MIVNITNSRTMLLSIYLLEFIMLTKSHESFFQVVLYAILQTKFAIPTDTQNMLQTARPQIENDAYDLTIMDLKNK